MKAQKTILSLTTVLGICVLFLILSTAAWAASPVIFYSDLTAGPNTGGQNNNGVFVTIWGNNFGSTQGSSYVTVGGGQVNNYPTWTNTMICFQLGPNVSTGNIVLVTSNGNATGPSFKVQAGNIYFVQPGAASNGSGTYASPFNHLYYYENIANPGDTVYVMAGTIGDEVDGHSGWHSVICPERGGIQGSPVSWIAYPNATVTFSINGGTATWTDGSSGGSDKVSYIFRGFTNWHTISKFYMVFTGSSTNLEVPIDDTYNTNGVSGDGWKIVGNNITAPSYSDEAIIAFSGNYSQVLGNEVHDSSEPSMNNEAHAIYWANGGNPGEIGWNYMHGNSNIGWEIQLFHMGYGSEPARVGSIHDNLIIASSAGADKGILLGDVDSGETQSTVETQNIKIYNNVIVNAGQSGNGGSIQAVSGTGYIYNNTIYGSGTEKEGMIQFPSGGIGPGGGHPVWSVANNIIYNSLSSSLYLSDGNGNAPTWTNFVLLTNNNYYGQGNGPTQDVHSINTNPLFVSPSTSIGGNFQLQATSPDINAGYNTTAIVAEDLSGLLRSTAPTIGAYEYTGASVIPSSPVVAITSPSTGSNLTAGTNITITTTASETNGTISNISLYNGAGVLLGSGSSSPYNYVMTNAAVGIYSFTAVATDANGVSTTSSAITITVSAQSILPSPPVVSITSPTSGSSYTAGSNVTITTTASETNGTISNISLYNGSGILLGSSSTSPYNYVYSSILAGGYSFYAAAMDTLGVSTTSSSITLTVTAPSSPVVSITSPSNGSNFTVGSSVKFNASASETNGSISKVVFYNGSSSLGTSKNSPYSYTWKSMAAGNYSITAKAYDKNNNTTMSTPVVITVAASAVAPSITAQPASVTVNAPATATFSVTATGAPAPSYQWMQSVNGGAYTNISGATSASYTTPATTTANSGTKFECVVSNASGSVTSNAASLTVNPTPVAPNITTQPVSMTVTAPAMASFSVAASGTPAPTYQWMQSVNGGSFTNISGATSASYTTPATTTANSGTQYKCVATNTSGSVTSNTASLIVNPTPVSPSITTQPVSVTLNAPAAATFTVLASGTPAPTYQWMQSVNGGAYTNISGATSASYTTPATTTANSGTQFECVVSNASGSVTSNAASLTVNPTPVAPSITTQPVSVTLNASAAATFTVLASGTPAPTYQWMQSVNGGSFTNISGATSASYTTPATTTANSGTQFECVVSNASGSVTSNAASLTVNPTPVAPSITTQPVSVTLNASAAATFTVLASGTPAPTYQWMQSVNGGSFTNISGATSASYTTPATTTANSGTQFECVVSNASGSVTSNAASLTVNPTPVAPSITTQPVSMTVTAPAMASFSVAASGTPTPTYQWMQSVNGGSFTNISGATSASYTTPATTTANSGTKFKCVATNTSGSVTSNAASLTVNPAPVAPSITTQPVSVTLNAPAAATFTVLASGTPAPTYQWMQSVNGGSFTNISGATSASYTTPATTTANSGTQFECVVSNASGSVTSNAASLTVNPTPVAPSITTQPVNVTVTTPETATFYVSAIGTPAPSYQWMQSVNGGSFTNISGATSASYTTPATTTANSGTQFECVVSNASGSVTSNAASLTVNPTPALPSIITQPASVTLNAPAAATFTVLASGTPAPTYQWMQSVNGGSFTNISGATSASYTTPATTTANSGTQYECVVSNASGNVTSNAAVLTVNASNLIFL